MIPSKSHPCSYYSDKSPNYDIKSAMTEISVTSGGNINGNSDRKECRDNKIGRWCRGLASKEGLGGIGDWGCGQRRFVVI